MSSVRFPAPKALALAAIGGFVLYVAIDIALVFLRPEFSVLHNAESDYGSKGAWAWLMDLNFLLRCALSMAVVLALGILYGRRGPLRVGLGLLTVWAVASGLLAFFPDDPVGTVQHAASHVHAVLALVAFAGVAIGTRATSRGLRRNADWRPVRVPLAALSYGALVPALLLARAHIRPYSLGGFWEKLFLATELTWFLLAACWVVALTNREAERHTPI